MVIAPMLELKVLTWARKCGAFLRCSPCNDDALSHNRPDFLLGQRSEVRLVRLGEGEEESGGGTTIDWSNSIKCSEDSVAKVSEKFNGAPQYCVDLVRQRMIFESVLGLKDALLHICQDPDVVVVSIENGMVIPDSIPHTTHHQDSGNGTVFVKPTVTVYLIMTTPQAHDMQVAGFVLEVEQAGCETFGIFSNVLSAIIVHIAKLSSQSSPSSRRRCAMACKECSGGLLGFCPVRVMQKIWSAALHTYCTRK